MPVIRAWVIAAGTGGLLALLAAAGGGQFQNRWMGDVLPASDDGKGARAAPAPAVQVPSPGNRAAPLLAQAGPETGSPAPAAPPQVDESALRYFAQQGDKQRLEREIARLRALYPNWTPPADPLAAPANIDERLEAIWRLYSEGKLAEARQAIARRQTDEPNWQPPADLLDRLALAEARERLLNASQIGQYGTVINVASGNPQLLTCSEVDVLWRVAEAFVRTDREARAQDTYRYILSNCDNPQERLATMQNAARLLSPPLVNELLALERPGETGTEEAGTGEFASVRDDLARNAVARGGSDAAITVAEDQLAHVEKLAREKGSASDALLLGWYDIRRERFRQAEEWFSMAREREDTADTAQGLALALSARHAYAEAEATLYRWRGETDETRATYLATVANLLGVEPRVKLSGEVLQRIVAEVAAARDVPAARQLGWYARAWEQHQTARQWFETALRWNPDDEPSAYGLALTRHLLGDAAGLAEIKRGWAGRSDRIRQVGMGATEAAPAPGVDTPSPAPRPVASETSAAPLPRKAMPRSTPRTVASGRRNCPAHIHPETLSPQAALERGWCLMDANRPLEAAQAFEIALRAPAERVRRDASYGQSLAYLRSGLVDDAAVAAARAPQNGQRAAELQTAILAERALGAFERGRYTEALIALEQRAQLAPERIDLMVLRGYAYLKMRRFEDARRVFEAAAGTGSRDGLRGLADLRAAMGSP